MFHSAVRYIIFTIVCKLSSLTIFLHNQAEPCVSHFRPLVLTHTLSLSHWVAAGCHTVWAAGEGLVSVAADCCHRNLGLHILPGIPTQWNTLSLSWRCSCIEEHTQIWAHTFVKGFPGCRVVFISGKMCYLFGNYFHLNIRGSGLSGSNR